MARFCNVCGKKLSFLSGSLCKECGTAFENVEHDVLGTRKVTESQIELLKKHDKKSIVDLYVDIFDSWVSAHSEEEIDLDAQEIATLGEIQNKLDLTDEDVEFDKRVRRCLVLLDFDNIKRDILSTEKVTERQLEVLKEFDKESIVKLYCDVYNGFQADKELDKQEIETLNKIRDKLRLTNEEIGLDGSGVEEPIYCCKCGKEATQGDSSCAKCGVDLALTEVDYELSPSRDYQQQERLFAAIYELVMPPDIKTRRSVPGLNDSISVVAELLSAHVETPLAALWGVFENGRFGLLVATNSRLLAYNKGSFSGKSEVRDFTYDMISYINHKVGWFLGDITITFFTRGSLSIKRCDRKKVLTFSESVRDRIGNKGGLNVKGRGEYSSQSSLGSQASLDSKSLANELAKLATLRDNGVLSETEFLEAKKKLLR